LVNVIPGIAVSALILVYLGRIYKAEKGGRHRRYAARARERL